MVGLWRGASGITAALLAASSVFAQPAPNAHPTGGVVTAGTAAIAQSATTTTIDQVSQRTAINWQSFDIGSQQSVLFNQPSASAVALNRVVGPDPSQIAGRIGANGQIIIVNQSGVTFFQGAQVNTSGLMVTAAGIHDADFMAGSMNFNQPAAPNARVVNDGTITVANAGLAALVAPSVANSGTISATLGHVVLAGARTATLDLYGDGLLSLDVTNQVTQAPSGTIALVTNTGVIQANGGTVQLTARAADGVVRNLVQSGGTVKADNGTVVLNGIGGSIAVEGQLSAAGGNIEVAGTGNVTVAGTAIISTSGKHGGGVVAIGTTLARAGGGPSVTPTLVSANVTVAPGAIISADATRRGNGGRVTLLATGTTTMAGSISARGGPAAGNGGFIETSGSSVVLGAGAIIQANARSPTGKRGTWLLDPLDLDVVNGNTSTNVSGNPFTPTGTGSQIGNAIIDNLLNQGVNVVLTTQGTSGGAAGNITVDAGAPIAWATGATLTLTAAGGIVINAAVTGSSAAVTFTAGTGGIVLNAAVGAASLDLNTTGGGVSQTAPVTATLVSSTGGVTGTVALTNSGNQVGLLTNMTVTGGDLNFVDNTDLTLNRAIGGNNVFIEVNSAGGTLQLGTLIRVAPGIIPADVTAASGGRVSLVADNYNVLFSGSTPPNAVTAPNGSVELAPFSPINASVLGTTGLIINNNMLSIVSTTGGVLDIGGYTNVPIGATTPTASAGSVTIDNNLTLASAVAATLELQSQGSITQTLGAIAVGTLTGNAGGAVSLTGANNIAVLGTSAVSPFDATGQSFTLIDPNATTLTVNGLTADTVSLTAPSIDIPGVLTATTSANLVATAGGIAGAGSLTTALLTGSATGAVDLTGANNVAALGTSAVSPFDATGQSFTLLDPNATTLTVNGLTADTVSLTAPSIDIPGVLTATTSANLVATAGGITGAGSLTTPLLTGSANGAVNLTGNNNVAALGTSAASPFAATNQSFTLNDPNATALTVNGLTADTVSLTAPSIDIPGVLTATTSANLVATGGGITESGSLITALLTGSANGIATFNGTNQVAALGNFSANGFVLNDAVNLAIDGILTAPTIVIQAPTSQVVLADGATIATGGTVRPAGPIQVALEPSNGGPGAFIVAASFVQIGTSNVSGIGGGGGPSTLQIVTSGNMQFDPPLGLNATGTWLILGLTNGAAAGNVFVGALDILFGSPGGSNLFGTINGIAGGIAAASGFIQPAINAAYRFNNCVIEATVCSPPTVPPTTTLGGLQPFLPGSPQPFVPLPNLATIGFLMLPEQPGDWVDPDVVPPNISYVDY